MVKDYKLGEFYECVVLPAVFERLEHVFGGYEWIRWGSGFKGTCRQETAAHADWNHIWCHCPWGFISRSGKAVSWLAFLGHGTCPTGDAFVGAVRKLAERAGVAEKFDWDDLSASEVREAEKLARQREILETFLAYCQESLCGEHAGAVREKLCGELGVATEAIGTLSLGFYTSPQEVAEHLLQLGFDSDEVVDSRLVCDPRLLGRLVIPWRDRWGRIKTLLARDLDERPGDGSRTLYLKGGTRTEAFALDAALWSWAGGREHLILVDGILDVLFFQSHGLWNVAALGAAGQPLAARHWEKLAECGVKAVTLALGEGKGSGRILESVKEVNQAGRAPQVFVVTGDDLCQEPGAAAFVRRHGVEEFRQVLRRRIHGYRYVALDIIQKHHDGGEWSDAELTATLQEAVEFDAQVHDAERGLDLERFFWPTILEATQVSWDTLRRLWGERLRPRTEKRYRKWHSRNLKQFLRELKEKLAREDYDGFQGLVCEAAADFQADDEQIRQQGGTWLPSAAWWAARQEKAPAPPAARTTARDFAPPAAENGHRQPPAPHTSRQTSPSAAEVRELAYHLWERNGRPGGLEQKFWFEAEQTLKTKQVE